MIEKVSQGKLRKTGNILVVLFIEKKITLVKYWKNMSSEKINFVLGDKLPTVYDAAISIFEVATQPEQKKM